MTFITAPNAADSRAMPGDPAAPLIDYGPEIEREIGALQAVIAADSTLAATYDARWLAICLLEGDPDLQAKVRTAPGGASILAEVERTGARAQAALGDDIETAIADRRYRFIAEVVRTAVERPPSADFTRSDRIDQIVTHPVLGVPIFLVLMWFVFQMTANVSGVLLDWIDGVIGGPVTRWVIAILGALGLGGSWFESLVVDGIITGAGGVLTFVPVLAFLYFFIALLEDSGYMARAAYVMDRAMQMLGLHGKSFIPLLVGFGCSVPGIYATRTLEDHRDRVLTGLLVPFMSCAARLPVYVLIGTAFFGVQSGNLVFAMYLVGIAVAILSGFLLRHTLFRRADDLPFVMELPPFRQPSLKTIGRQVWQRTRGFVSGVWTVIMFASVAVWVLLNIPYHEGQPPALEESLFGGASRALAPVFRPAGFGDWEATGSLMTGLVAKEVVVSTMGQIYGVDGDEAAAADAPAPPLLDDVQTIITGLGTAALDTVKATISLLPGIDLVGQDAASDETSLQAALRHHFSPLEAVAFSVFVLLYTPCMATIGALRQEFGTRWMWFSVLYMLAVAWLVATLVYQAGRLLGWG